MPNEIENLRAVLVRFAASTLIELHCNAFHASDHDTSVGALIDLGDDRPGKWVYGKDLKTLQPSDLVVALSINSTVQAARQATETYMVDLGRGTPEQVVALYDAALKSVEIEAAEIAKAYKAV